jgi:hypothetical protein
MSAQPSIVLKRNAHMKEKDMTNKAPTARRLIHFLAGPALALGLTLGSAGVANALPEWDIGAYDQCMAGIPTIMTPQEYELASHECCVKSGGIWDFDKGDCGAPGVESQGRNPLASDAPTHVMQPMPLPGQGPDIGPATGGVG